ncbi:MAG: hypothetical protein H0W30_01210 [Gemmatimonadaceae bacterium]|nr:hypothetical protein [Gemmatimonadaceae bacterium]
MLAMRSTTRLEVLSAKIAPSERAIVDAVARLERGSTSATVRRLLIDAARERLCELTSGGVGSLDDARAEHPMRAGGNPAARRRINLRNAKSRQAGERGDSMQQALNDKILIASLD